MAFMASLMALPMSAPSGSWRRVEKRALSGRREDTFGLVIALADGAASGALSGEAGLGLGEFVVGVAQKDEAEDGDGVLGRLQLGIGAELVGGSPEAFFEFGGVGGHGGLGALPVGFEVHEATVYRILVGVNDFSYLGFVNADNAEHLALLTERVIGAVFEVANTLGAGFLEKVYERSLLFDDGHTDLQSARIAVVYWGRG